MELQAVSASGQSNIPKFSQASINAAAASRVLASKRLSWVSSQVRRARRERAEGSLSNSAGNSPRASERIGQMAIALDGRLVGGQSRTRVREHGAKQVGKQQRQRFGQKPLALFGVRTCQLFPGRGGTGSSSGRLGHTLSVAAPPAAATMTYRASARQLPACSTGPREFALQSLECAAWNPERHWRRALLCPWAAPSGVSWPATPVR